MGGAREIWSRNDLNMSKCTAKRRSGDSGYELPLEYGPEVIVCVTFWGCAEKCLRLMHYSQFMMRLNSIFLSQALLTFIGI